MAQNIQVFVRCRPLNPHERRNVVEVVSSRREIKVLDRSASTSDTKNLYFDQVFGPDARQIDVYDTVVKPLIDQVLLGFNCTVFAYGQTGTGKTYTMEGYRSDENLSWEDDPHCGVIPRAISQLFETLKDHEDSESTVSVSFLELYNEDTYDLLSPSDDATKLTKLKMFEDSRKKGSVIVGNLETIAVQSKAQIFEILKRGSAKRQTAATHLNACSSRSHTIFTVTVHIKEGSVEGEELVKIGKLNLVDLAGSENIGRSGAQDKRAREAGQINQSLLTLGRVIKALVEKSSHVPYRESKLTRLLQDSLGGKTKTSIIATISPSFTDLEDTLSTLDYATRAKKITNKPEMNQRLTKKAMVRELRQEMERLRKDLHAAREKNGIYIQEDNYKEMCEKLSARDSMVRELEDRLAAYQAEEEKYHELLQIAKIATNDIHLLHGKTERQRSLLKANRVSLDKCHNEIVNDLSRMGSSNRTCANEIVSRIESFRVLQEKKLDQQNRNLQYVSADIHLAAEDLLKEADELSSQAETLEKQKNQIEAMLTAQKDRVSAQINQLNAQLDQLTTINTTQKNHLDTHINQLNARAAKLRSKSKAFKTNGDTVKFSSLNSDIVINTQEFRDLLEAMQNTGERERASVISKIELLEGEFKEDAINGTTPQKKSFNIPKCLIKVPANDSISEDVEEKEDNLM